MEQQQKTEQPITQDINITAEAAEEIRRVKVENNIPESAALRLGVKSGGCCGVSYLMGFDNRPQETDRIYQIEGLTVYVDVNSLMQLSGTTVNFSADPEGRGFYFDNPNVERSCNCGDSCSD